MASDLSIIIPTNDLLIEKTLVIYRTGKTVFKNDEDSSLWRTVIYELCKEEDIYDDLSFRIKDLTEDIDCCEYHEDFSKKTQEKLQVEKNRIVESVFLLKRMDDHKRSSLLHELELLLDAGERYVNKRIRILKTVELVEKLENRMKQFQVDVQIGDQTEIPLFKEELKEIEKEMQFLKIFGANEKEIKRLNSLFDYAVENIAELEKGM
jgi:hypothetical protein